MSQRRRYIDDIAYSEAHRHALPELYERIGHRLDVADRDWTEFCHHCKEPLAVIETVRDVGQDIRDKATTVTRRLANRAQLRAWLVAWRVERPEAVQRRIDELGRELLALQAAHPIVSFKVRELCPPGKVIELSPREWWEHVLLVHRTHHKVCLDAKRRGELPVHAVRLQSAQHRSPIWRVDKQTPLPGFDGSTGEAA
jgi:hypothetical protein